MQTVKVVIGGKTFENVPVNNSGWLSPTGNAELIELCRKAPRVSINSKGVPIIKDDFGHNIYLGASEYRNPDERHAPGSSASASSYKPDEGVVAEWKQAMQELDLQKYPKLTAFFGVEDPIESAVTALMAVGFTEEQARTTVAAQKK